MSVQSNEAAQKTINEDFPLALPKGSILAGQYTIDDVLGQGGFGITYVATDYKTGQKVAVKEFFPDSLAYREMTTVISYPGERAENYEYGKENFLGEAKTLAEFIGCDNIVRIFSYFEENGTAYFVMEYIEGVSFDHYLKERGGKIGCDEAKSILVPVMEALAIVHSKGIVHRDVTPDNIYITNDGTVKLLDFGAARYSLGDKSKSLDVILKHGFAPKEQYTRRGKQGPFTDIYSLGATFYFAITGRRPPDSIDRIEEDELIPPSSLGVKITSYQEEAILHALEVSPQSRYQSMLDFRNVLLNETAPAPASAAVNQHFFTAPPTPAAMPAQQIPYTAQQPYNMPQQQPYAMPPQQTENVTKLGDAAKQLGSAAVQLGGGVAKQLGNTAKQLGGSAAKHMSNAAKQLSEAAEKRKAEEAAKREAEEKRKAEEAAKNEAVPQSVPEVQHDEPLQSNSEIPHTVQNADAPVIQPAANQPASSVPQKKKSKTGLIVGIAAAVLVVGLAIGLNNNGKDDPVVKSAATDNVIKKTPAVTGEIEDEELDWSDALGKSPEEAVKILEKVCGVSLPYYIENYEVNIYYTSKTNSAIPFIDGIDMYFNSVIVECNEDNVVYKVGFYYSGPEIYDGSTYHTGDECTLVYNALYESFCEAFGEQYETKEYTDNFTYVWDVDGLYDLYLRWIEKYPDGTKNDVIIMWIDNTLDPYANQQNTSANEKSTITQEQANENAKHCHTACSTYITSEYIKGNEISGEINGSGMDFTIGGVKVDFTTDLGEDFTGYTYGYVSDGGGGEYVLWSDNPIPDEYKHQLTAEEQEELAQNGTVIGCFPAPRKEEGGASSDVVMVTDQPYGDGKYTGEWKNDKPNGQGKITRGGGDVYEGEWKDGSKNGYGKYKWAETGVIFEGEYKDDKRNGQGKETYADGSFYEGEWKDDYKDGQGKYTTSDGSVVTEVWKDGEKIEENSGESSGVVMVTDKLYNHSYYTGEWKDDKPNGHGKQTLTNGAVYEGEFKDGKKNGQGKMTYANGDVYEGEWKDGLFNGQGKLTSADGSVVTGIWKDGELIE